MGGGCTQNRANAAGLDTSSASLELQRKHIHRLWAQYNELPGADAGMMPGENWYVLDQKWWDQWTQASGFRSGKAQAAKVSDAVSGGASISPPCIKNTRLVHHEDLASVLAPVVDGEEKETASKTYLRLRPNLQEGRDFALVPAEVWNALVAWYGGGPALPRIVSRKCVDNDIDVDSSNEPSAPVKLKCTILLYPENGMPKRASICTSTSSFQRSSDRGWDPVTMFRNCMQTTRSGCSDVTP